MPPQRWMLVPIAFSTGSARSRSASSPPTMMARSPVFARGTPPETGASIIATPRAARSAAISRVLPGWPLVMSMTSVPLASTGAISAATSATCLLVGTMVTTQSAPLAASAGPAAALPPTSVTNFAAWPGRASQTVTSKPAFTRLAAIGQPMLPMPMKATDLIGGHAHFVPRQGAFLDQHLMRRLEGVEPGGDAAIGRRVQQGRLDLLDRHAVGQRALDVQLDLRRAVQRGQHRQVQQAAGLAVERRVAPGPAPGDGGGGALEGHHEVVGLGHATHRRIRRPAPRGGSAGPCRTGRYLRTWCSSLVWAGRLAREGPRVNRAGAANRSAAGLLRCGHGDPASARPPTASPTCPTCISAPSCRRSSPPWPRSWRATRPTWSPSAAT